MFRRLTLWGDLICKLCNSKNGTENFNLFHVLSVRSQLHCYGEFDGEPQLGAIRLLLFRLRHGVQVQHQLGHRRGFPAAVFPPEPTAEAEPEPEPEPVVAAAVRLGGAVAAHVSA